MKKGSAVFTMVYNDMVILELWLKYYSQWFDHVLVLGVGTDGQYGELEDFTEKYGCKFQRIGYTDSPDATLGIILEKQNELLQDHEWVLFCNCDEFLVPGKKYKNLKDLMQKYEGDYIACEAFDVYQADDELPIDYTKPYLKQRKHWFKNISYNKTLLSRVPLEWAAGCHRLADMTDEEEKAIADTGLYLVHLKYSDPTPYPPRHLGPYTRSLDGELLEKGEKQNLLIPNRIRRAF